VDCAVSERDLMKKAAVFLVSAFLTFALCTSCAGEPVPRVSQELRILALKAGKADAFVLTCGGHALILDTAEKEDADKLLELLRAEGIASADALVVTHFDKDHVGGAAKLLRNIAVGTVFEPDYEEESDEMDDYREALQDAGIAATTLMAPLSFALGEAECTLWPSGLVTDNGNDLSLFLTVTHGDNRFLFTGDGGAARLEEWLGEHQEQYTFLKAPHHGGWNGVSKIFYLTAEPEVCFITASEKNPADPETMGVLNSMGTHVYLTQNGTLTLVSDGWALHVTQE